jgi:ubiquinone/menaquinone biosynthesis C-methylase UbiE
MTRPQPLQAEVRAHYQEIASGYNARANQTCERTYCRLVGRFLRGRPRLLELGGGSSDLLEKLGSPTAVACDLSREMLLRRPPEDKSYRVVAVGEQLPFGDARFDGVFSINVLEHVVDLERVVAESVRVLTDEGLWLAVTPNGNWERLLDLAERWSLKIPEGPHRFLTSRRLGQAVGRQMDILEHRTMLMLPAGPPALSSFVDAVSLCSRWGWGFFQYIVARKRTGTRTA